MKVLVLIISDESSQVYIEHKKIWLKYMNLNPSFDCFFIEYHPEKNYIIEENTIFIKGVESYHPGIREKTIDCFKYFLNCDINYDYIIRTNLSSLWNFKALSTYLETLPKEGVYSGVIGDCHVKYASGSGFIMTPDVVHKIVENRNLCNEMNFIDDVDIGYLLKKINIFPFPNSRTDILDNHTLNNFKYENNIYHYRMRFNENRNDEILATKKVLDMILADSI
jgi:hypothetical protein